MVQGATANERIEVYTRWAGDDAERWDRIQQLEETATIEQLSALEWVLLTLKIGTGAVWRSDSPTNQALVDLADALDHFISLAVNAVADYLREVLECLGPPVRRILLAATLSRRYPRLARPVCWVVARLPKWAITWLYRRFVQEV